MIDRIQRLTLDDLPGCLALARDRDWQPEERKWRLLFDVGTVYGLRDDSGDLVGTTILTRFGTAFAAIGNVLVATRYGGRGLGRKLMTHALAEAGDAVVYLHATEFGRPLYEKLGFVAVGTNYTHVGRLQPMDRPVGSRPARPDDLPAILALDTEVNGVDRNRLVERLPDVTERLRVVARHGNITGYAAAWRNDTNVGIGPVVAASVDDATALIADLAAGVDEPVRLDLDDRYPQLRDWATRHGVPLRNSTTVMVLDGRPLPGDRSRWFIPVMQAVG